MNYRLIGLAALPVLFGAALFVLSRAPSAAAEPPALSAPWEERVAYWESEIRRVGGDAAYEELAAHLEGHSIEDRHEEAHVFGGALFTVERADGIGTCDSRFSFGCFHQFLGEAIAALGLESVPDLNAKCFDALQDTPLSCQHGIGHGVIAAVGYSDESMRRALDICHGLPGTDPIGGCYGGVFMEYNVRTMLADQASAREYMGNPLAPCDAFAEEEFAIACIYWQPQWWIPTILQGLPDDEQFVAMGGYCREFSNTPVRERACFEGIGNIVMIEAGLDPVRARELCDIAGENDRQRLLCRAIGANHFGLDSGEEKASVVCDDLAGRAREYCLGYARNDLNIANIGEVPL